MTENEAKKYVLLNVLMSNKELLQWYWEVMLSTLPDTYTTIFFNVLRLVGGKYNLKRETLWVIIPGLFGHLSADQCALLFDHMKGIGAKIDTDYAKYVGKTPEQLSTIIETIKPVSGAGTTYDNHRDDREWQDDVSEQSHSGSSIVMLSNSDTGYQG